MRNRGNVGTRFAVTPASMSTFDLMPKRVRDTLANANHNWSCEEAYDALTFDLEPEDLIGRIRRLDAKLADEHYALLSTGRPYPT